MIKMQKIESKETWEAFIGSHKEANFLQSWYWGEFQKSIGKEVEYLGFYNGLTLVGICLVIIEKAKRGTYLTVAGGPILDWSNTELLNGCFESLKTLATEHKASFARVRPQLVENELSSAIFNKYGFSPAPMHLTADLTSQIDLSRSEEELLEGMRKTTRYEIRKAEKLGVTVSTSLNVDDIDSFYELQLQTSLRQKFVPFSLSFLKEQFRVFVQNNNALLYRAYLGKTLLAEAFIIFYGQEATYHYGASTDDGRKVPGAYLLQWEAIKEAKRRGLSRYNLWGVAKPEQTSHRFYGVSIFKRGFGGQDVAYVPAQDLVIDRLRYSVNYFIELARRKVRKLG